MKLLAVLIVMAVTALFMMTFLLPKNHPIPQKVNYINETYIIPLFKQ